MTAIKVNDKYFSGSSKLFTTSGGLAAVVRGLAQDNAAIKLQTAGITDFTDNSTGVAAAALVAMATPSAAYDGSSSGASPTAGFNTAADGLEDAFAVMADHLNRARGRIGLPLLSWTTGAIATGGTIPSITKALTTTSGATAIDYTTGLARMVAVRGNVRILAKALNELLTAVGSAKITDGSTGEFDGMAMGAVADATGGTGAPAGTTSISDTVMDAFLDAVANNIASMAYAYNNIFVQTGFTDLTDNSGGAVSSSVPAMTLVSTPYQDVATASAPFAAFNTELPKLENNFADLAARVNELAAANGLAVLTDSTGGTANTTIEVIDQALTAVDGTASNAMAATTYDVTMPEIANNVASLLAKVNALAAIYGEQAIADSSGGAAGSTLVALTDTTGVDNGAAATGVADAVVDAQMVIVTDAIASMAAALNALTGTDAQVELPLKVVAV